MSMGASTFAGVGLNVLLGLKLPKPVRYFYTILIGVVLQLYMYRLAVAHIYLMGLVTFAIISFMPRDVSHKYGVAWVLAYNSALFLYFYITCYGCWQMNVTTYTMILMTKLWGLVIAVHDGVVEEAKLTDS